MALKTTRFITSRLDRCDDDFTLPPGHVLYDWRWITPNECKSIILDRNEVLVEVQHGTLEEVAARMGVEIYRGESAYGK